MEHSKTPEQNRQTLNRVSSWQRVAMGMFRFLERQKRRFNTGVTAREIFISRAAMGMCNFWSVKNADLIRASRLVKFPYRALLWGCFNFLTFYFRFSCRMPSVSEPRTFNIAYFLAIFICSFVYAIPIRSVTISLRGQLHYQKIPLTRELIN